MSDLWRLTARDIVDLVTTRKASAREITESALARLDAVNPAINAVIDEFPEEALQSADQVDDMIARGEEVGPLAGVPITIKVNVDQTGHANTNGLRLQKDLIASEDNPVVSNLRKAGAVTVGRTNTPAFSLRWFTRNGLHGHTLNPRNPKITPGGSSGGAASAVAAGIGAIAHGSDIGGSIRYPAYACGVHGIRPTLGRIPQYNPSGPDRFVGAQLMAVQGPLARTIDDLELALQAMTTEDLRDPWWVPVPLELGEQPRRAALTVAPEGLDVAPEVETALREAAAVLKDAGWTVDEMECPPFREPARLQAILWLAEFRRASGEAIYNEDEPDSRFVYEQMVELCPEPDLNSMIDTLQARMGFVRQWQLFLQSYPVLLCPVSAELPFPDLLDVESPDAFRRVMEAQLTQVGLPLMGLPGLTVTTGLVGSTPVGVQLVGGRYHEDTLLAAGKVIEAAGTPASPVDPVS